MNDFGFILLIIMLFVGPAQLVTNIVAVFVTKSKRKRNYLLVYLGGVIIYFIGCFLGVNSNIGDTLPTLSWVLFFGGAFGLALYGGLAFFLGKRLP